MCSNRESISKPILYLIYLKRFQENLFLNVYATRKQTSYGFYVIQPS